MENALVGSVQLARRPKPRGSPGLLEYAPFNGASEELAEFTDRVWRSLYTGKFWYPRWNADFFRWQFTVHGRDVLPAARAGGSLVGCFPAMPLRMRIGKIETSGALVSWCTADPAYRGNRLALRLTEDLRRQCSEHGITLAIGVVSGDDASIAKRFWCRYAQLYPERGKFSRPFRWWVKILDKAALSEAAPDVWERAGLRTAGGILSSLPFSRENSVRQYAARDLDQAFKLVSVADAERDWVPIWTKDQLSKQLCSQVSDTLVAVHRGSLTGLVNWHLLTLQGRHEIRIAAIDVFASNTPRTAIGLLGTACVQLAKLGVHALLVMGNGSIPSSALLANLFIPRPTREDHLAVLFAHNSRCHGLADTPPGRWSLPFR